MATQARPASRRRPRRRAIAAVRALSLAHRRAACPTPTRPSSRCPTPRRPNGISPTPPGSSRPSCCAIMCPAIGSTTSAGPICSTPIMRARASAIRAPRRGMLSRPSLDEVRAWRARGRRGAARRDRRSAAPDAGRARPQSRAAASGTDADGPARDLRRKSARARRSGQPTAAAPAALPPGPIGWIAGRGRAWSRSAMTAPASPSTAKGRATRCCSIPTRSPTGRSPTPNGCGFIADGGYAEPAALAVRRLGLGAGEKGSRRRSTGCEARAAGRASALDGLQPVDPAEPVCHISYYEADAFARWAGARLPTEAEWEAPRPRLDPDGGNQLDAAGPVRPRRRRGAGFARCSAMSGNGPAAPIFPIRASSPAEGAVGEYNGKFMCAQMVLRGGSCATPRGHVRASYRNFFYPHQRWMFSGLRLARDSDGRADAPSRRRSGLPRRRARRPRRADPGGAGALALRPPRLGAVRGDHPASRILSDPDRDGAARAPQRRDRRRSSAAARRWSSSARARRPRRRSCSAPSRPAAYVPIDISGDFLRESAAGAAGRVSRTCRSIRSRPISCGRSRCRPRSRRLPKLGFFPGSTIGNLVARTAVDLLRAMKETLGRGLAAADRHGPDQGRRDPARAPMTMPPASPPRSTSTCSTGSTPSWAATFPSTPSATARSGTMR